MRLDVLEGSQLQVEIDAEAGWVDLYTFGVVQLSLQHIADKVAFRLLSEEGILEPSWKRPAYLPRRFQLEYPRLVRLTLQELSLQSPLFEILTIAVAAVISDPHSVAILENLAANVVWAIGQSGVRGVRTLWRRQEPIGEQQRMRGRQHRNDPIEIGPNVRDIVIAAQENPKIKRIRVKWIRGRQEEASVEILAGEE